MIKRFLLNLKYKLLGMPDGSKVKTENIRRIYRNKSFNFPFPEEITGSTIETEAIAKLNDEQGFRLESAFQSLTESNCFSIYRSESDECKRGQRIATENIIKFLSDCSDEVRRRKTYTNNEDAIAREKARQETATSNKPLSI